MIDVCNADISEKVVNADVCHINRILNTKLSGESMAELLSSISIPAEVCENKLRIKIPHFRTDIEDGIETDWDIAEEIGRLYGYDNIEPTLMHGDSFQGRLSRSVIIEDRVKDTMAAMGFMELYNYNFTSPQEYDLLLIPENDEKRNTVRLQNPFGEDQSLMRTTLIGGLLRTMRTNCNKKSGHGRFFEIGNVHFNNPDLPEERKMLGIIAYGGAGNVRNAENFFTLKGIIEKLFEILGIENARFERGGGAYLHPGQKAVVSIDGEVIGEMGCTHPRVEKNFGLSCNAYLAEIDFNKLAAHTNNSRKYRPLPKFPIVPRDIAVVVDRNIEAQTVIDIINTAKTQVIVENAKVFDVYYPKEAGDKGIPEGKKSMAFSFELRSDERTLTDEDINRAVNTILKALKFRLDAVLRS